jgi:hypothetical protein
MKYEKKMMPVIFALTLLSSIMLQLSGCGKSSATTSSSTTSKTSTTSKASATSQLSGNVLVTSADRNVSINVPAGWNTSDLGLFPGAAIGVSDDAVNEYLIITEKPKADVKANSTINDYLNLAKSVFGLAVTKGVWGQPSNITIGGCKGLAIQLTGLRRSDGSDTTYFVNLLESKNYFYNISGYTLTASADANKSTLEKIINSFKEKD